MADAFAAQLRAIDARNAAMAGIGTSRAGIQYQKETEQQEEAKRDVARAQQKEAGRTQREAAKIEERGTWGGFIGGTLGKALAGWGAKQAAGTALKTILGSSLGAVATPAIAAYALSKALTHKKAKGFKGKEINEADIANIETEYFRKPQTKQIRFDIGQINTQIRSAKDIMTASRESIAQGLALQFGTAALQEQAWAKMFGQLDKTTAAGTMAAPSYAGPGGFAPPTQEVGGDIAKQLMNLPTKGAAFKMARSLGMEQFQWGDEKRWYNTMLETESRPDWLEHLRKKRIGFPTGGK